MSDSPLTEPLHVPSGNRGLRQMFQALGERSFRIFAPSQLASTTAVWMQRLAQDWLILQLTGSVALVGLMVVFQFGPVLILGMWGGVIVDRRSTRQLLVIAQVGAMAVSAVLAVLTFTELVSPMSLFVAAAILGLISVVDQPARQVFVSELVAHSRMANAIAMNSAIFQVGGLLGSALGGLLLPLGAAWTFAVSAALAMVSLGCLIGISAGDLHPRTPAPRAQQQIVEALRYASSKPEILWTLVIIAFVSLVGLNWQLLLAAFADRVFESGASGYGLYNAVLAIGALAGAILTLRRIRISLRALFSVTAAFALLKVMSAVVPVQPVFLALVAAAGLFSILMWTTANTLLQSSSNPRIRGRIMSIYLLLAVGGQALGGLILGWIAEDLGAQWAMAISGGVPLLACVAIFVPLWVRARV